MTHRITIIIFCLGIIAIGTKELGRTWARQKPRAQISARELIDELHGEVDVKKASISPRALDEINRAQSEQSNTQQPSTMQRINSIKDSAESTFNKVVEPSQAE